MFHLRLCLIAAIATLTVSLSMSVGREIRGDLIVIATAHAQSASECGLKCQAEKLRQGNKVLDERIADQDRKITDQDREITDLDRKITELRSQLASISAEIQQVGERIAVSDRFLDVGKMTMMQVMMYARAKSNNDADSTKKAKQDINERIKAIVDMRNAILGSANGSQRTADNMAQFIGLICGYIRVDVCEENKFW